MREYLFALFIVFDKGVVDTEDICRINNFLNLLVPLEGQVWHCPFHESLANFSNAVMMTDATAAFENFIPGSIFNDFILFDQVIHVHSQITVI